MSSLEQQFISEARELLDEATACLLALEQSPDDSDNLDGAFRAVHTIKGSSGLFDVPALTRLIHAAEDLLDAVKAGGARLDSGTIDLLLSGLDHVAAWLDALESAGRLPEDASQIGESFAERIRACHRQTGADGVDQGGTPAPAPGDPAAPPEYHQPPEWLAAAAGDDLLAAFRRARAGEPLTAVTYRPDPECFFQGEDPLHLAGQIPELAALVIDTTEPLPPLEDLDPFRCVLLLGAITHADPGAVRELFRYVPDQITVYELPPEALIRPWGEPGVFLPDERFSDRLRGQLADGDQEGARRSVETALAMLNAASWTGCCLRWMAAELETHQPDRRVVDALLTAIEEQRDPELKLPVPDTAASNAPATGAGSDTATRGTGEPGPADPPGAPPATRSTTLRVDQASIDALGDLIGELVVAKNGLPFLARRAEHDFGVRELARELKDHFNVIHRIAQAMQGTIMRVQMMPMGLVFQRFPRLVRDVSRKLDKSVELVIEGEETEADKNIVEALTDPLTHMVRNSLDHGIEPPAQRRAAGKPERATVRLTALQEGDRVIVEVADDGKGIDPEQVRQAALDKGLMDAGALDALHEQQILQLVMAPGFSTAREVSDLSGRGVGMDVVRTAIEQWGGQIGVESHPGEGTLFRLSLPLTMAISRVMQIDVHGQLFGIPMDEVVETVKIPHDRIVPIKHHEAFVLRDRVVPIVRLDDVLGLRDEPAAASADAAACENGDGAGSNDSGEEAVLVVRLRDQICGLVVSDFHEGTEVILKPLDGILAELTAYSGSALLGDGRVLLVLNLKELL